MPSRRALEAQRRDRTGQGIGEPEARLVARVGERGFAVGDPARRVGVRDGVAVGVAVALAGDRVAPAHGVPVQKAGRSPAPRHPRGRAFVGERLVDQERGVPRGVERRIRVPPGLGARLAALLERRQTGEVVVDARTPDVDLVEQKGVGRLAGVGQRPRPVGEQHAGAESQRRRDPVDELGELIGLQLLPVVGLVVDVEVPLVLPAVDRVQAEELAEVGGQLGTHRGRVERRPGPALQEGIRRICEQSR